MRPLSGCSAPVIRLKNVLFPAPLDPTSAPVMISRSFPSMKPAAAAVYAVTFTIVGFSTVKRDGIELTGFFTAAVNVEMRVGAVEETITVTGETPIVDVQNVMQKSTATREQMASLKSIEIDERTIDGAAPGVRKVKISMSDKRQALMDLAKIARMLPADRLEHSGPGGGPIAFLEGMDKALRELAEPGKNLP